VESIKQLWMLAMWVRGAYLRVRRVLPFLTIGFIQKMMLLRWVARRYVLPRYGGTYTSTATALAPKIDAAAKYLVGGEAWGALRRCADGCVIAINELRFSEGKGSARLSTALAVIAALIAREVLGLVVHAIMVPDKKAVS
jgi:hypothetical protein